jgi:hypothetical protein
VKRSDKAGGSLFSPGVVALVIRQCQLERNPSDANDFPSRLQRSVGRICGPSFFRRSITARRLTEVATMLSISPGSVRRLVKLGVLPRTEFSARAHRFRYSHVQAVLQMLTTGGASMRLRSAADLACRTAPSDLLPRI